MGGYFPMFFLLALVFTAWLAFERLKSSKQDEERVRAFWQRENDANNTRRKNLDTLTYIKVPNWITLDALSSALPTDDAELNRCSDIFKSLSSQRILNLTGMTSTDIWIAYQIAPISSRKKISVCASPQSTAIKSIPIIVSGQHQNPGGHGRGMIFLMTCSLLGKNTVKRKVVSKISLQL